MLGDSDPELWVMKPAQDIAQEPIPMMFKILKEVAKGTEVVSPICTPLFSSVGIGCGECYVAASVLCCASLIGGGTIGGVVGSLSGGDLDFEPEQAETLKTAIVAEH